MPSTFAALSRPIGTVLDRVRDAFGTPRAGAIAVGVVVLVAIGTTAGILALGAVFDATIDQQVTVDNPDRPPESTCDSFGDDADSPVADRCDEPEQIDVDAGSELRDAANEYLHYGLIGVPIWWVAFALALHAGARLAGGSGSVTDSFVVAGWALFAELIRLAAGLAAIWYALSAAELSGTTVEAFVNEVVAAVGATTGPLLAVSAVTIALQWVVVVGGLEAEHDLDRAAAAGVATVFAAIALLLAAV